jgi:transcriptional regulator with XRE-family HTH domain
LQPLDTERVREWRHRRMLSQQEVADRAGTSLFTIQRIERGEGNVRPKTGRAVAAALGVPIEELLPKAQAPLWSDEPPDERRAHWDAAVRSARQLRERGQARAEELLALWEESKDREEDPAERRPYLDEMGELLQQAYDARPTLFQAMSYERWPEQWPEVQAADSFYGELWQLVEMAGLRIRTGDAQEERPKAVEESAAA